MRSIIWATHHSHRGKLFQILTLDQPKIGLCYCCEMSKMTVKHQYEQFFASWPVQDQLSDVRCPWVKNHPTFPEQMAGLLRRRFDFKKPFDVFPVIPMETNAFPHLSNPSLSTLSLFASKIKGRSSQLHYISASFMPISRLH